MSKLKADYLLFYLTQVPLNGKVYNFSRQISNHNKIQENKTL